MNEPRVDGKRGRSIPLSVPRRIMGDLLAFAQRVPTVPVQRVLNVGAVTAARGRLGPGAPSWVAIFARGYAIVASRTPELRRAYLSLPRPRLYEHPFSVASIAIEREYQGENVVFWGHLRCPEDKTLADLHDRLRRFKQEPVESIGLFRKALKLGRLPRPLRRLAWWVGLNAFGGKRASQFGTFGISVYSGLGAESLHPISPLTTTLNYGVIQPDGTVSVRIVYDHRVLDGATIARALASLEAVLNTEIAAELNATSSAQAA